MFSGFCIVFSMDPLLSEINLYYYYYYYHCYYRCGPVGSVPVDPDGWAGRLCHIRARWTPRRHLHGYHQARCRGCVKLPSTGGATRGVAANTRCVTVNTRGVTVNTRRATANTRERWQSFSTLSIALVAIACFTKIDSTIICRVWQTASWTT